MDNLITNNAIKAHISEIEFNNGEKLSIQKNDIVLFVGPNNAGKSQSLNDIYTRCGGDQPTIVVKKIACHKSEGSLLELLRTITKLQDNGVQYSFYINGNGHGFDKRNGESNFRCQENYGQYKDAFVCKLDTENRLAICNPAVNINRDASKNNPIHYAAFDSKYAKWLSENFRKAFGQDLTANFYHGASIPLCIGTLVKLDDVYASELERSNDYANILENYKQVQLQGDGIKSFTGILLYLMLDYYCTYFIDEPEAFLHPPQARIMGQIIGETLRDDQQAFISTHSEEIVKGLLDVCEERLKIVRITRKDDINSFSILDNQFIKKVFSDPLLKYSNIMSSLFHKTVVLCESDSDCKLYSLIDSHIKQTEGKHSETLFIHCGGKHRMAKIVKALRALNIDIRLIPDIDVINDENVIKPIAEAFGIEWNEIKKDIHIISSNLHSSKESISRNIANMEINQVLSSSNASELSNKEIKLIQDIIKTISKWDVIKHGGKQSLPPGDATNAYNHLESILNSHHVYLVPVGELEGFIKEVGGHGPEWVNSVLEEYPDLNDPVYEKIKQFIRSTEL